MEAMLALRVRVWQLCESIHVCLYLLQVGSERSVMLLREAERSLCSPSGAAPSPGTAAPGPAAPGCPVAVPRPPLLLDERPS